MGLGMLCARRAAILAALTGGTLIAIVGAGVCAEGLVWGGSACLGAFRSGLALLGI